MYESIPYHMVESQLTEPSSQDCAPYEDIEETLGEKIHHEYLARSDMSQRKPSKDGDGIEESHFTDKPTSMMEMTSFASSACGDANNRTYDFHITKTGPTDNYFSVKETSADAAIVMNAKTVRSVELQNTLEERASIVADKGGDFTLQVKGYMHMKLDESQVDGASEYKPGGHESKINGEDECSSLGKDTGMDNWDKDESGYIVLDEN